MMKRWLTLVVLGCAVLPVISSAGDVTVAVVNVVRLQTEAPQVAQVRERIKAEFLSREVKTSAQQEQINQLFSSQGIKSTSGTETLPESSTMVGFVSPVGYNLPPLSIFLVSIRFFTVPKS